MKFTIYAVAALAILGAVTMPVAADTQSDRDGLVGNWVENGGSHGWVIQSSANGLHMTQIEGSSPVADFTCATNGQDCNIKISGHKATVSLYYNGSALVQLETKSDVVVKRRFSVNGSAMKVEVTPMTGKVVTEDHEFERGGTTTRK